MFLTKLLRAADHPYLFGKGGRTKNNGLCQGMTVASLKHHTALQPLFVIMGIGIVFVAAYIGRFVLFYNLSSFTLPSPLNQLSVNFQTCLQDY